MNVGLYTNIYKDKDLVVTRKLLESLRSEGILCYGYDNLSEELECEGYFTDDDDIELDMLLAIGGDGTILSIAKWCAVHKIPVLGINLGKVGFLTEAEPENFADLASDIACGRYTVEERTMLCGQLGGKRVHALNEIVIARRNVSKMIMLKVDIDGAPVDKHYCDGFIVCTPTGSTAYSLSAGGPAISPTSRVFSLTPINSHSLHARPIIIGDNETIGITLVARADDAMVIADGKNICALPEKETMHIFKAQKKALFVRLKGSSFYERLLRKLNTWSITPGEEE